MNQAQRTEERKMMAEALSRYLRERYPFEQYWHTLKNEGGFSRKLWHGLADDLGILGAALPEECGGMGGDLEDHALIARELGSALAGEPYLSTAVIGATLLRHSASPRAREILARIPAGEEILAFAYAEPRGRFNLADVRTRLETRGRGCVLTGHKAVVRNARWATHMLVTARGEHGIAVALLPADTPGMRARHYPSVDGAQAAELYFEDVPLAPEQIVLPGDALPLVELAADHATVALCAEGVGIMRRLLSDTVAYARERRQFGVPIASFQTLRHRIADMYMQLEQAEALTELTLSRLREPDTDRARLVSALKVTVAKACRQVGQGAIQIHGGMGMTDELPVGHYFKRAAMIEGLFGNVHHHLRRYADRDAAVAPAPAGARTETA